MRSTLERLNEVRSVLSPSLPSVFPNLGSFCQMSSSVRPASGPEQRGAATVLTRPAALTRLKCLPASAR